MKTKILTRLITFALSVASPIPVVATPSLTARSWRRLDKKRRSR